MSAPAFDLRTVSRTQALAREIGATFRRARLAKGDHTRDIAVAIGSKATSPHNITRFERGENANLMLGTALRYLNLYGYTLAVVPVKRREDDRRPFRLLEISR